jgi:hypothetical protein
MFSMSIYLSICFDYSSKIGEFYCLIPSMLGCRSTATYANISFSSLPYFSGYSSSWTASSSRTLESSSSISTGICSLLGEGLSSVALSNSSKFSFAGRRDCLF